MRHRARLALLCTVLFVTVPFLSSCSNSVPTHTDIALFGDSLSFEAQPCYVELVHAAGDFAYT